MHNSTLNENDIDESVTEYIAKDGKKYFIHHAVEKYHNPGTLDPNILEPITLNPIIKEKYPCGSYIFTPVVSDESGEWLCDFKDRTPKYVYATSVHTRMLIHVEVGLIKGTMVKGVAYHLQGDRFVPAKDIPIEVYSFDSPIQLTLFRDLGNRDAISSSG